MSTPRQANEGLLKSDQIKSIVSYRMFKKYNRPQKIEPKEFYLLYLSFQIFRLQCLNNFLDEI